LCQSIDNPTKQLSPPADRPRTTARGRRSVPAAAPAPGGRPPCGRVAPQHHSATARRTTRHPGRPPQQQPPMGHLVAGFLLLAGVLVGDISAADDAVGLTLRIFDNTGRAPSKGMRTQHLDTPHFNFSTAEPFSAEITGTIHFNESGVYSFYCNFTRTTTAFVWVDGHMICSVRVLVRISTNIATRSVILVSPASAVLCAGQPCIRCAAGGDGQPAPHSTGKDAALSGSHHVQWIGPEAALRPGLDPRRPVTRLLQRHRPSVRLQDGGKQSNGQRLGFRGARLRCGGHVIRRSRGRPGCGGTRGCPDLCPASAIR
jgi:hypothetical protein